MNDTAVAITCGGCARTFKWKPELAGKKGKCKCGGTVRFPADDPAPPAHREADLLDEPAIGRGQAPVRAQEGAYDLNEPVPPAAKTPKAPPPMPATAGKRSAAAATCIGCGTALQAGAVLCTACGTHQKTGKKLGTTVARTTNLPTAPGKPAAGVDWSALTPWLIMGGVLSAAGLAIGLGLLLPENSALIFEGVGIVGAVIGAIGSIWGIWVATGDNVGLRVLCRFVPFLGLVLVIIKAASAWDEMKGPVLTMLTGIGVAAMGFIMLAGTHG